MGTGRGWQQKSRSCDDNSSPSGRVWPLLPTVPLRHVFGRPRPPTHPNRAMGGRLFDMLGPVVYRAGWTGDFTGFYACRARIAPGQHPWVGLPTMQFECSRIGGQWWVSGGVVASASAPTHRPPSTGGRGGGCSFKPKKYHANTCPASPDV